MLSTCLISLAFAGAGLNETPAPESRAVAFLSREVPSWSKNNKCFSCHNNGDAARALLQARARSYVVPAKVLDDTTRWLTRPQQWEHNGGDGPSNDKVLARIQFAAALVDAIETGAVKDRQALLEAAALVAAHQEKSGEWKVSAGDIVGSPVTYGSCLATYLCRRTLATADRERFRGAIAAADRWLRTVTVHNVMDAAAVLLALADAADDKVAAQRQRCLQLIRKGEDKDGGWGPYVNSAPESFDTALVLLALARSARTAEVRPMLQRGRNYLIATQKQDGSWPETTRPAGAESYAQRISTTGWALQALLATAEKKR
jgi:Squalene-hopene cyclase C-terminal domain